MPDTAICVPTREYLFRKLIRQLRIDRFNARPVRKKCIDTFGIEVFVAL